MKRTTIVEETPPSLGKRLGQFVAFVAGLGALTCGVTAALRISDSFRQISPDAFSLWLGLLAGLGLLAVVLAALAWVAVMLIRWRMAREAQQAETRAAMPAPQPATPPVIVIPTFGAPGFGYPPAQGQLSGPAWEPPTERQFVVIGEE